MDSEIEKSFRDDSLSKKLKSNESEPKSIGNVKDRSNMKYDSKRGMFYIDSILKVSTKKDK